jgi:hypothetical protein
MLQILTERGFVNPDEILAKYKKEPNKKKDLDEDGEIKEEIKPFILSYLVKQCPDLFALEKSALRHLADALSTGDTYKVTIEFTPKYHCEIAGEGIKYCWGFIKKIYQKAWLDAK